MRKGIRFISKDTIEIMLRGSSHDRRKQYRAICRKYPDHEIKLRSLHFSHKVIDGQRVVVEDANSPQTQVIIKLPEVSNA
jgi:hypothetical protein